MRWRRVISAVPFISVTEQVADAYRAVLDPTGTGDVVLEHHSGIRTRAEAQAGNGLWSRLATENWDATFLVTTTVRLLETMFANGTSDVRRLHRMARSVIIVDEVQSIPWRLVEPTLEVLRDLVRHYGCTVVVSTATQPPFDRIGDLEGAEPRQLLDPRWFDEFRRTRAVFEPLPLTWPEIGDRVHAEAERHAGQCLAVFNTIKDAGALTRQLVGHEGLFYLSTRLCQEHRRDVLREVNGRLGAGRPCLLVSTQLVEAGVDIDFPVAFRAVAPMTAIAQVAGRVNRHGLRTEGVLHVIDPSEGGSPPDEYRIGCNVTRDLLRNGVDPLSAFSMPPARSPTRNGSSASVNSSTSRTSPTGTGSSPTTQRAWWSVTAASMQRASSCRRTRTSAGGSTDACSGTSSRCAEASSSRCSRPGSSPSLGAGCTSGMASMTRCSVFRPNAPRRR